jgi:hypothetical protein
VALPDFGLRFGNCRILSGSPYVAYHPIVTDASRAQWEEYQLSQRILYQQEYDKEATARAFQDHQFGRTPTESVPSWDEENDVITNFGPTGRAPAPNGSEPYLPVMLISPIMPTFPNLNVLTLPFLAGGHSEASATGQAVIDLAMNLAPEVGYDTRDYFSTILARSQYRYKVQEYLGDPTSSFSYPVFDSFDLENRKVVAILGSTLYWRLYFTDVLSDAQGIVCVLENSRNQTFSYQIDDTVKYLGPGDFHDSTYDYLVQSGDLASYISERA